MPQAARRAKVRFVLFSAARSGTTFAIHRLGLHPHVRAHTEVFQKEMKPGLLVPQLRDAPWVMARDADRPAFLEHIWANPGPCHAVGLKMWYRQDPQIAEALLADRGIHKIILERPNRLAQFSSWLFAREQGRNKHVRRMATLAGKPMPEPEKLRFDRAAFVSFCRSGDRNFQRYRDLACGPVMNIAYPAIVESDMFDVQAFLGLPQMPLALPTQRINPPGILTRFAAQDHAAIRDSLADLGQPAWVDE